MFKKGTSESGSSSRELAPTNVPRKLSARDVALGLGRPATDEELEEYLNRNTGAMVPLEKAIKQIKKRLQKKRTAQKKWKS